MDNIDSTYYFIFVLCVILSAFFSSAETAFISIPKLRAKHLVNTQIKGALLLEKLLDEPGKFLSAILLGNNLVNIGAAAIGTIIAIGIIGPAWGALASTIGVTTIILVFGEVIPKTFAAHHAERVALLYTKPVQFIIWILYPFVLVLNRIGISFTKLVAESTDSNKTVNEDEIRTAITLGEAEGVWEEAEAAMLHKAFEFTDTPVREAMTPRTEIIWVEIGISFVRFLEIYDQYPHSRFPVYSGTTDNVVGILFIKDVLKTQLDSQFSNENPIDPLLRPAYFVPESKHLGALLTEMRDNNYSIALVVDEFGGIAGMVTLEQLLEEIVGSIGDELAVEVEDIVTIDANTYEVDGGLRIEDANSELNLNLPADGYETMAGFVLDHMGRIPKQGEQFRYKNLTLAILEMRGMKIERILVTKEGDAAITS